MNILGIISGSSLDGLDLALCSFKQVDQLKWKVIKTGTREFSKDLQQELSQATSMSSRQLLGLEVSFSKFCVEAINNFLADEECKPDLIASHGHTVFHQPQEGYTLQIGKGSILAEGTGCQTACDFRSNDIALGGEGAPVAPIVEQYLYQGYDVYFNLGGIANVSFHNEQIRSIDSCPCNQVLNLLASHFDLSYDDRGDIARKGKVHEAMLAAWSKLPYFQVNGPKSMDNSWVKDTFVPIMDEFDLAIQDKLASMVEFCALQLTNDIAVLGVQSNDTQLKGLVTGGGALNDYLIERMSEHFKSLNLSLTLPDKQTINFKEAILMSLMGYLRVQEVPNTIPSVTGAKKPTIGGAIYLPTS